MVIITEAGIQIYEENEELHDLFYPPNRQHRARARFFYGAALVISAKCHLVGSSYNMGQLNGMRYDW